ncbi:MAG: flagellar protein FlaG [Pseudomonadota bacterium]
MEGISQNTKVTQNTSAVPQTIDTSRGVGNRVGEGQVQTDLPTDQSVQAAQKAEKDESVKTSALARVEKALSEAFGEGFVKLRIEVEKDEASGRFVYKAVNKDSGQVERQFPSEAMLKIMSSIEGRDGKILDDSA